MIERAHRCFHLRYDMQQTAKEIIHLFESAKRGS
jgi:hypothetical protein